MSRIRCVFQEKIIMDILWTEGSDPSQSLKETKFSISMFILNVSQNSVYSPICYAQEHTSLGVVLQFLVFGFKVLNAWLMIIKVVSVLKIAVKLIFPELLAWYY